MYQAATRTQADWNSVCPRRNLGVRTAPGRTPGIVRTHCRPESALYVLTEFIFFILSTIFTPTFIWRRSCCYRGCGGCLSSISAASNAMSAVKNYALIKIHRVFLRVNFLLEFFVKVERVSFLWWLMRGFGWFFQRCWTRAWFHNIWISFWILSDSTFLRQDSWD